MSARHAAHARRSLVYLGGHEYDDATFNQSVRAVSPRFVEHVACAAADAVPRAPYPLPPRADPLVRRRRMHYEPVAYVVAPPVARAVVALADRLGVRRAVGVLLGHMLDCTAGAYTAQPLLAWPPRRARVHRLPDEDPHGPVDAWMQRIAIPPIDPAVPARVALICMWVGPLPFYYNYFARSAAFGQRQGMCCAGSRRCSRAPQASSTLSSPRSGCCRALRRPTCMWCT